MSHKEEELAENEAQLIIQLGQKGSAFIIKGYEAFKTPEGHICIVTEYAQQGDLGMLLRQKPTEK